MMEFRDSFYKQLARDYSFYGTRSRIGTYFDQDFEQSARSLSPAEIRKQKYGIVSFYYYCRSLEQHLSIRSPESFDDFMGVLCSVFARSRVFFYLTSQRTSGASTENPVIRQLFLFLRPGLCEIRKQHRYLSDQTIKLLDKVLLLSGIRISGISSNTMHNLLKIFTEAPRKTVPEEILRELYTETLASPETAKRLRSLLSLLKINMLHYTIRTFFYDSGYTYTDNDTAVSLLTPNILHPENTRTNGRKARVDKTMQLLEHCKEVMEFHKEETPETRKEQAWQLFEVVWKGEYGEEYNNLFFPLFQDEKTGVAMCIAGKDYFSEYYEDLGGRQKKIFQKSAFPCALLLLRLVHDGDAGMIPSSIFYEYDGYVSYSASEAQPDQELPFVDDDAYSTREIFENPDVNPRDYFDDMYVRFQIRRKEAESLLDEQNRLTFIPEGIPARFAAYFTKVSPSSPDQKIRKEAQNLAAQYIKDFEKEALHSR